ncbi:helix-turn-helix domain-containing protein [Rossellomorea aquimaris]|uniref:helix-turn-helix domain-containing protein n=1 Tax=Rossellomorea aquimaris TaxID=189382 RepID=UPI001653DCBC|nr:helix-turn-helix domain-containing protein [Rossellomorea aquimaris]
MRIGDVIKYQRVEKHFTQEELCKDICSVSYLSKIENGATIPSDEIIKLLFKKLGIESFQEQDESVDKSSRLLILNFYRDLIEKKKNVEEQSAIWEMEESSIISKNKILNEVVLARYFLFKKMLHKAERIISKLEGIIENYLPQENFIFYKDRGILKYFYGDYKGALNDFRFCLSLVSNSKFFDWDLADLYFQLSLTNGKLQKVQSSIEFAQKALLYYDQDYNYLRSADCQMILGISYQRLEDYEGAIKSYNLALKIGETFNDINLMSAINHNLGYLNSLNNNYLLAIGYFEKSLELRVQKMDEGNINLKKILNTIHSIIQLNYKKENIIEVQKYLQLGNSYISQFKDLINYEYKLHFSTYEKLIGDQSDCIEYIENCVMPYFIEKGNSRYVYKYSKMAAKILESKRKYKKSVYFYKLASKTAESLIPKTFIE